eukprot:TRINITY_DN61850_c0_g1_i1.p1 TRINITY_DN61850_c0_g1~~TRINITY_DN61850_c0_g1_i1.p1  ORF type:complete len:658 (+),score=105.01 TRINITY_DN61850_c0_g1_i1:94-2067(+)
MAQPWPPPSPAPAAPLPRNCPRGPRRATLEPGAWLPYLINLDSRQDRLRRMVWQLRQEQWLLAELMRVRAVDGTGLALSKLPPELLLNRHSKAGSDHAVPEPRFVTFGETGIEVNTDWLHMTPGAVGCALSHRIAWEHLVNNRPEAIWALVLEDDLTYIVPNLEQRIAAVLECLPPADEWDLCYLGWHGCARAAFEASAGSSEHPGPLLPWCEDLRPLGTFGYLVSTGGAQRLLDPEAKRVFPLAFQLDKQINMACKDGGLRAFLWWDPSHTKALEGISVVGASACLVQSPLCQLSDSDVQTVWHADHPEDLRSLKEAIKDRIEALDSAIEQAESTTSAPLPTTLRGTVEASATSLGPHVVAASLNTAENLASCRRVAVYVAASDYDVEQLAATLEVIRRPRGDLEDLWTIVVWYGADGDMRPQLPEHCKYWPLTVSNARLEAEWPGLGGLACATATLVLRLAVLHMLVSLQVDEILCLACGGTDIGERARRVLLGIPVKGPRSSQRQSAVGELRGLFPLDSTKLLGQEHGSKFTKDVFSRSAKCSNWSSLLPVGAHMAPPFDLDVFVFVGKARIEMVTWLKGFFLLTLQFSQISTEGGRRLAVDAGPASDPLLTTNQASDLAFRCILGFAGLTVSFVPEHHGTTTDGCDDGFETVD